MFDILDAVQNGVNYIVPTGIKAVFADVYDIAVARKKTLRSALHLTFASVFLVSFMMLTLYWDTYYSVLHGLVLGGLQGGWSADTHPGVLTAANILTYFFSVLIGISVGEVVGQNVFQLFSYLTTGEKNYYRYRLSKEATEKLSETLTPEKIDKIIQNLKKLHHDYTADPIFGPRIEAATQEFCENGNIALYEILLTEMSTFLSKPKLDLSLITEVQEALKAYHLQGNPTLLDNLIKEMHIESQGVMGSHIFTPDEVRSSLSRFLLEDNPLFLFQLLVRMNVACRKKNDRLSTAADNFRLEAMEATPPITTGFEQRTRAGNFVALWTDDSNKLSLPSSLTLSM